MKKVLKQFFAQGIFYILFFGLVVLVFAFFDLGFRWDNLNIDDLDVLGYITLILFRLIIYICPAIIMYPFVRKKCSISKCYSLQFCWYSILLALYNLLSLDYILKVDLFSKLDSFVFILGFVLSLIFNKQLPVETTDKFKQDK